MLHRVASAYGQRPSDLLLGDANSYFIDRAIWTIGKRIDDESERRNKDGKPKYKRMKDVIKAVKPQSEVLMDADMAEALIKAFFGAAPVAD